jgi:glycosidase
VAPPRDPPAWLDAAVLYGVTPYLLHPRQGFREARRRLPEWADLGIDALWLQPVFRTHGGGQGYDVVDFFRLRTDYGDEADFAALVGAAHGLGMRVLLDLPANHVSEQHPWYRNLCETGEASPFRRHFQTSASAADRAPYASHYRPNAHGHIGYFWEGMVNLDYENPAVRRGIKDVAAFWMRRYDVDGYRIDAAWAISARCPEFLPELRRALRALKPDAVLIAEDKASRRGTFETGCDAAYDWAAGERWVSQWSWQTRWHPRNNHTVFNAPAGTRAAALRGALFNGPGGGLPPGKVLRFLENNDTHRFIRHHGPARTRLAAALLFTLPGLPLLYNGQEIGLSEHPYRSGTLFPPGAPISAGDRDGLYGTYRSLIRLRKSEPALRGSGLAELPIAGGPDLFAYLRPHPRRPVLCLFNLGDGPVDARFAYAPARAWRTFFAAGALPVPAADGWSLRLGPRDARILAPLG